MIVSHHLEVVALCPVDGLPDVYRCTVRCRHVLPVEDILKASSALAGQKLYQEELTRRLHRLLAAEVETVGWHSGVTTVCVEGGE